MVTAYSTRYHPHKNFERDAIAAFQRQQWPKAIRLFERIVKLEPQNFAARANLATAHYHAGNAEQAASLFGDCMMNDPHNPEIRFFLASALRSCGHLSESIDQYRATIQLRPGHFDAHNDLTLTYMQLDRLGEARDAAETHARIAPADWRGHFHIGLANYKMGNISDSIKFYETALKLERNVANLYSCYAAALMDRGDFEAAERNWREALRLDPNHSASHNNFSLLLLRLYRHEEAWAENTIACSLEPNNTDYYNNRGEICRQIGQPEMAIGAYDRALYYNPENIEAFFARGITCLSIGRWFEGWYGYLGRKAVRPMVPRLFRGILPKDLSGKTVIIERDQGLGDELSFLRFTPLLKHRGATVIYLSDPRLIPLLQRSKTHIADELRPWTPDSVDCDYRVAVGDLPYLLASEDIPPPFLIEPSQPRMFRMSRQLNFGFGPPFIGVTWRAGDATEKGTLFKSIDPFLLGQILHDVPGSMVIMQRNPTADEIDAFERGAGRPAHNMAGFNDDIEDIFALSGLLNEYVTVSNTNVHFRAAHGLASRVLVPTPPDFRWMASGDQSPWFPASKIYRQSPDTGLWNGAASALRLDLRPEAVPSVSQIPA